MIKTSLTISMDLLVKVQVDVESDKVISNSTPFEIAVDKSVINMTLKYSPGQAPAGKLRNVLEGD